MPEGDTVYRAARELDEALTGRVLTLSDFRVPAYATVDLAGRTVLGTIPRGKHLLTRFSAAGDSPPLTLHTHLKMEGIWQVQRPGDKWRRPTHLLRVRLAVGERDAADRIDALGFELGVVDLAPTAEEDTFVGHLGPDLLGPDWDVDEALRRMRGTDQDRAIAEVLLDQRVLAGVGNVFKSEICFVSGVHPHTPVGQLDDAKLRKMLVLSQRMLEANKLRGERTTTGIARRGQRLWVYGRRDQPCRRCGAKIRRAEDGEPGKERSTYWCPGCQAT
ncbi:DNA-formamidopyrimidine glycosylase family protein [Nocardioides massiliensis]|uniref:DNA-(apurinic or apyrimidinic site) lyase n=1 Tax=Nocardioides massiliensis TaxID=1325935 RepID=A0ABT9NQM4_9ACTN|nr:DNA-formamidopyrimidine glycosylase family protein [Nocardioides massiliensis]MDP9822678.1 endonuclease-8 [Nocardioides massiliensis]